MILRSFAGRLFNNGHHSTSGGLGHASDPQWPSQYSRQATLTPDTSSAWRVSSWDFQARSSAEQHRESAGLRPRLPNKRSTTASGTEILPFPWKVELPISRHIRYSTLAPSAPP